MALALLLAPVGAAAAAVRAARAAAAAFDVAGRRDVGSAGLAPVAAAAADWVTCGGLPPARNNTACPATATCCHQKWAPGIGHWGCVDNDSWGPDFSGPSWQ